MAREFESTAHHARMYRYHDQMARVLSMKKGHNRELQRQHDYHVKRCTHHQECMAPEEPRESGPGASK